MKKIIAFLSILLIIGSAIFAGGAGEVAKTNELSEDEAHLYDDVAPLAENTKLVISTHAGTHHAFIVFLIEQFGGYDKANIDADIVTFSGGPVQMEALTSNSWDCGTTGIGGVFNGVLRNDLVVIGPAAKDNASINIFAKNDSDIVKTGPTTPSGVYGTAEEWRGKEIAVTTGTTLHYTLSQGLAELGLGLDDVSIIHMDVSGVNTALLAGRAEIGGVWGSYSYGEALNKAYTPVITALGLNSDISITLVANPNSYNDPAKKEAIAKFVELYYKTAEWVYANDGANLDKAAEYFTAINENSGITSTKEANLTTLTKDKITTLEEAYNMVSSTTESGFTPLFDSHYNLLEFYATNIGSYTLQDLEDFKKATFDGSIIIDLFENQ